VHTQLLVTKADLGYLFALIAGRGVVKYEIHRDDKLNDWLGNYCNDWWSRHVIADVAPEFRNPDLSVVKRLRKTEGKRVELGSDVVELCEQWKAASAAKLAFEKEADGLQARILLALNDATEASLPGGASLVSKEVSVKAQVREEYTYRSLYFKK
jgi:predicted phage-related endonuclease